MLILKIKLYRSSMTLRGAVSYDTIPVRLILLLLNNNRSPILLINPQLHQTCFKESPDDLKKGDEINMCGKL